MIINNILIGEDIRQELGNKLSLMGIIGSSIDVDVTNKPKEMPVRLFFACLVSFESIKSENDLMGLTIQISLTIGDNKIADIKAKLKSTGNGRIFHFPVPRFQINVSENSKLSVHAKIKKDDRLLAEKRTTLNINLKQN